MVDPLFWLGLSILLVAVSLTAVLVAALPALRELARAARSAEKLFDTLSRELPPTLEAIRLTGLEITDLKEDMSQGVQSAGRVAQQIDQSVSGVRNQAKQAQVATRSVFAGVKAAWKALNRPTPPRRSRPLSPVDLADRSASRPASPEPENPYLVQSTAFAAESYLDSDSFDEDSLNAASHRADPDAAPRSSPPPDSERDSNRQSTGHRSGRSLDPLTLKTSPRDYRDQD